MAGAISHDQNFKNLTVNYVSCRLAEIPADEWLDSRNPVARINLRHMKFSPERRVEIYAAAVRGLLELEPDERRRMKYSDFKADIRRAPQQNPSMSGQSDPPSAPTQRGTEMELRECIIPEGPSEIFNLVEPVLTRIFGTGRFWLGGDTALAAIWRHRHSTDIDLFMESAECRAVSLDPAKHGRLVRDLGQTLAPSRLEVRIGFLKTESPLGELSLMTAPSPLAENIPVGRVKGTRVPLEPPSTIIARKLQDRMLGNGVFVVRDIFDIAAAAQLDKAELLVALDSLDDSDRKALRDELSRLPADWMERPESGRAIIHPARPPLLAKDPVQCIPIALAALAGKLPTSASQVDPDKGQGMST